MPVRRPKGAAGPAIAALGLLVSLAAAAAGGPEPGRAPPPPPPHAPDALGPGPGTVAPAAAAAVVGVLGLGLGAWLGLLVAPRLLPRPRLLAPAADALPTPPVGGGDDLLDRARALATRGLVLVVPGPDHADAVREALAALPTARLLENPEEPAEVDRLLAAADLLAAVAPAAILVDPAGLAPPVGGDRGAALRALRHGLPRGVELVLANRR